jgi:hypothetical protein
MSFANLEYELDYPSLNGGGAFDFDLPKIELGSFDGGGVIGTSGIGSLLGGVGIPFGGAIGGVLDGFLNFGKSPVGSFYAAANTLKDVVLPRLKVQYSDDLSKMFTEMSKATEYMILHYKAHRSGSSSPHSIQGNQKGLDIVSEIRKGLYATAKAFKSDYTVAYKTVSKTYQKGFISEIKGFNGNHSGMFRDYRITAKKSFFSSDKGTGVPNVDSPQKVGFASWLLLPIAVVVGVLVFLFTKKK